MASAHFREILIRRITRWIEGEGAPVYDGKKSALSHFRIMVDDGVLREVTRIDWTREERVPNIVDSILDYANEHAFSYRSRGFAPQYFLRVHFSGLDRHSHEYNLETVQPENDGLETSTVSMIDGNRRAARTDDTLLQLVKITTDRANRAEDRAATQSERIVERLLGENKDLRDGFMQLFKDLQVALDAKVERDNKAMSHALKIRVQSALADQGIGALPAFTGLGVRYLNAKMGVKDDAPLSDELEMFAASLADLDATELKPIIDKLKTKEEKERVLLAIQRYRGRRQIKRLDSAAIAMQDGVTRPMPLSRFMELAKEEAEKKKAPAVQQVTANAGNGNGAGAGAQRPSPFAKH